MREIKFRAWEKKRKEMIPVYSIGFENGMINTEFAWRFLDEIELMQFAGLKDKNGKEIYEGDILSVQGGNEHQGFREFSETGYVEFSGGSFMLAYHSYGNKVFADFGHFDKEDTEVIGNIYENPELVQQP